MAVPAPSVCSPVMGSCERNDSAISCFSTGPRCRAAISHLFFFLLCPTEPHPQPETYPRRITSHTKPQTWKSPSGLSQSADRGAHALPCARQPHGHGSQACGSRKSQSPASPHQGWVGLSGPVRFLHWHSRRNGSYSRLGRPHGLHPAPHTVSTPPRMHVSTGKACCCLFFFSLGYFLVSLFAHYTPFFCCLVFVTTTYTF